MDRHGHEQDQSQYNFPYSTLASRPDINQCITYNQELGQAYGSYGHGDRQTIVRLYEELDDFKRNPSQPISEYLHAFERKCDNLSSLGFNIPDIIKSVRLLKGANLSESDREMARMNSGTELEFEKTKKALTAFENKITGLLPIVFNSIPEETHSKTLLQSEDVYSTTNLPIKKRDFDCFEEAVSENYTPSSSLPISPPRKMNKSSKRKRKILLKRSKCYNCGVRGHWAQDCPEPDEMYGNSTNCMAKYAP